MRQVPAQFKLMGHTVKVELRKEMDDALGLCYPDKLLIAVQEPRQETIPQSVALQTFLHEWVHMAFWNIGEHELYDNERVVDLMAQCLYQLLITKRGKAAPRS